LTKRATVKNVAKVLNKLFANGWAYEQVCLAEMFKFSTNVTGKLAYSTCYSQYGNIPINYLRRTEPFCFIFVGGNLKFEYLYIK